MRGKKYRKPEEMKDSRIEWIGEIPKEWEVKRLKFISKCFPSNVDKKSKKGEETVRLCNYTDVYYNDYIIDTLEFMIATATKEQIKKYQLCAGDIILTKDSESPDDIGIASYVKNVTKNLVCGYHLTLIRVLKDNYSQYIYFQILSNGVKNYFATVANGITRYGIGIDGFKNLLICLPKKIEQQKIANFLYIKTAQFNSIIQKKEQLIEKLEEAKKSLISEVVTGKVKIVDGQMVQRKPEEMKDSGIEWIGMIPKTWRITKLKYNGEAVIGLTYSPNNIVEKDGTLVLRSSNVQGGKITFDDCVFVNKKIPKKLKTRKGDILICSRNGSRNLIGKNACINEESEGYTFGAFMTVFRSDMWEFLSYVFNSTLFDYQSSSFLTSTINQLTISNLNSFIIAIPQISEQLYICDYLRKKLFDIDELLSKIQNQIQKLKEAKQSLISEAVTGKIDLRDWEIIEEGGA